MKCTYTDDDRMEKGPVTEILMSTSGIAADEPMSAFMLAVRVCYTRLPA